MKISKNLIYLVALFTIFSLFNFTLGQGGTSNLEPPIVNPVLETTFTGQESVREVIFNIFEWIFRILTWVAAAAAVLFIMWGGVNVIFQGKIDEGKTRLIYGVIGLVIALISYALVTVIHTIVTTGGLGG